VVVLTSAKNRSSAEKAHSGHDRFHNTHRIKANQLRVGSPAIRESASRTDDQRRSAGDQKHRERDFSDDRKLQRPAGLRSQSNSA
jgi:hypothetical protein